MKIIRGEAEQQGHPKIMLDSESRWKPRFQDYRHIQWAKVGTLVTVDSESSECNTSYVSVMRNQRHIQNQRQIQNQAFYNDNPMRCTAKDLAKNGIEKGPVTLVTADSEATKYNESYIGVERSQNDIRNLR